MHRWLWLLLLWLNLACASLPDVGIDRPLARDWHEVHSEHIVLRTDLPADDALALAREFEQDWANLQDLAFPYAHRPTVVTSVVVFRNHREYDQIAPFGAWGDYRPAIADDGSATPTVLLSGEMRPLARRVFVQHQMVREFVHYYFPGAPSWLLSGLADYYSTLFVTRGKAVVGAPRYSFTTPMRPAMTIPWILDVPTTVNQAPLFGVPSSAALLASRRRDFYAWPMARGSFTELDPDVVAGNRAGAWALVHLMRDPGGPFGARFEAYLALITGGHEPTAAFKRAFAGVGHNEIEGRYQAALRDPKRHYLQGDYRQPDVAVGPVRVLTDAEVHLLHAAMRPCVDLRGRDPGTPTHLSGMCKVWGDEQGVRRVHHDIGAAASTAPDSPEVQLWVARLAAREGRRNQAIDLLREAATHDRPGDLVHLELFRLLRDEAELHPGLDTRAEADAALIQLRKRATSAAALNAVARYLLDRGRVEEAGWAAEHAIAADPSCSICYDTYAALFQTAGDLPRAHWMQTVAVNITPDGYDPAALVERWYTLDELRRPPPLELARRAP